MKIHLLALLLLLISLHESHAAITITISPSGTGTLISVSQQSANPPFSRDLLVVGYIDGLALAAASIASADAILGTQNFTTSPGTLSLINEGRSSPIATLEISGNAGGPFNATLRLESFIVIGPPSSVHQLVLTPGQPSYNATPFATFIPGTYVEEDLLFGTITTHIVPEPGALPLTLLPVSLMLGRRRKSLAEN